MNHDEFENKLRSNDPAAHIEPRDAQAHRELLEHAMSAQPANVIPISKWTKRRKAVSAAAAALLVVGIGGPAISGSMSATPDRLVFGESTNPQGNAAVDSAVRGEDSKMLQGYQNFWGAFHYELSGDFVSELPASAPAYKIVNVENLEQRIADIAALLGVKNLNTSEDGTISNSDVMSSSDNFYSWTEDGFASFSYYNSDVDPWRNCYKEEPVENEEPVICDPINDNLPTEAEARTAAKQLLAKLGFEIENLQFEVSVNDYSVDVYANEKIAGEYSPINYYISYVSDLEIYSIGGSLTKLVVAGNYDLVSVDKAVERANELTDRNIALWNESNSNVDPGTSSEGSTSDDGDISEPSEPTVDADVSTTEYEPITVNVTRAELDYQIFNMSDGSVYWLPIAMFWGTTADYDVETSYGAIIAIVDSQIDLESLYSNWGMQPMARGGYID